MSANIENPTKHWLRDEHITLAKTRERYTAMVSAFSANPDDWRQFLEAKRAFDGWLFASTYWTPVASAASIEKYYIDSDVTFSPSDQTSNLSLDEQRQYYAGQAWEKFDPLRSNFTQLDIHCAVFMVEYPGQTGVFAQLDPKLSEGDFAAEGRPQQIAHAMVVLLQSNTA